MRCLSSVSCKVLWWVSTSMLYSITDYINIALEWPSSVFKICSTREAQVYAAVAVTVLKFHATYLIVTVPFKVWVCHWKWIYRIQTSIFYIIEFPQYLYLSSPQKVHFFVCFIVVVVFLKKVHLKIKSDGSGLKQNKTGPSLLLPVVDITNAY